MRPIRFLFKFLLLVLFLACKPEKTSLALQSKLTSLEIQNHLIHIYEENLHKTFSLSKEKPGKDFQSIGSGFFVDSSGYGITSLVSLAKLTQKKYYIRQNGTGKVYQVEEISRDTLTKLALLKVLDTIEVSTVDVIANNKPKPGNLYVGIASPYSLLETMVSGFVVQTLRANIDPGDLSFTYVQLDKPIAKESAGAAVFDLYGNLMGVLHPIEKLNPNVKKRFGFAIPTSDVYSFIVKQDFFRQAKLKISRGLVEIPILTPFLRKKLKLRQKHGVLVSYTRTASPAAKVLQRYDLIIAVEEKEIHNQAELWQQLERYKEKEILSLGIVRKQKKIQIQLIQGK
ncbi:MAG: S1C family serine protease [Spirochaetota bacterium]